MRFRFKPSCIKVFRRIIDLTLKTAKVLIHRDIVIRARVGLGGAVVVECLLIAVRTVITC